LLARVREAVAPLAPELEGKMRVVIAPAGGRVQVTVIGEAVHSSVAEDGQNALWGLAAVAERVGLCDGGIKSILTVVAKYFRGDHFGERLKLAYEHPTMGRLLVAPTMLRIENGEVRLSINMRRPAGRSVEEFRKMLDSALEALKKSVDRGLRQVEEPYVGEPALADTEGPLVPTLMEIYRRESGDTAAKPISIRGGTYARLFPGAVSFGPALPGRPYRGHAPDEYLEIDSLSLLLRTTFEAALALDALAIMK
jgi:acetylornithine deacetylase/succinyl-diaminopimelate desuccinylase-like protein